MATWAPSAMFLLPFLITFHVGQLILARILLEYYLTVDAIWQAGIGGTLFLVVGVCNLWVTLYTYYKNRLFFGKASAHAAARGVVPAATTAAATAPADAPASPPPSSSQSKRLE
jgi:hypothetical protein